MLLSQSRVFDRAGPDELRAEDIRDWVGGGMGEGLTSCSVSIAANPMMVCVLGHINSLGGASSGQGLQCRCSQILPIFGSRRANEMWSD